ncbi:hypothetical protein IM538_13045 [Cytobacillus suaedae]|nr:hypothetical protein IM538_13045 [Cytobacillus suaedae]
MLKRRTQVGYTIYKSTGVQHEYTNVDLENQKVTCTVTYRDKTYMTVVVDMKTDAVEIDSNLDALGDKAMDLESYIDMFKHHSRFFIENKISNPEEYYQNLK